MTPPTHILGCLMFLTSLLADSSALRYKREEKDTSSEVSAKFFGPVGGYPLNPLLYQQPLGAGLYPAAFNPLLQQPYPSYGGYPSTLTPLAVGGGLYPAHQLSYGGAAYPSLSPYAPNGNLYGAVGQVPYYPNSNGYKPALSGPYQPNLGASFNPTLLAPHQPNPGVSYNPSVAPYPVNGYNPGLQAGPYPSGPIGGFPASPYPLNVIQHPSMPYNPMTPPHQQASVAAGSQYQQAIPDPFSSSQAPYTPSSQGSYKPSVAVVETLYNTPSASPVSNAQRPYDAVVITAAPSSSYKPSSTSSSSYKPTSSQGSYNTPNYQAGSQYTVIPSRPSVQAFIQEIPNYDGPLYYSQVKPREPNDSVLSVGGQLSFPSD